MKLKTVKDFIRFESVMTDEQLQAFRAVQCPSEIEGVKIPATLDALTLEQLATFWGIKTSADLFSVCASVLLGMSPDKVMKAPLLPIMGLANFCAAEIERITNLWNSTRVQHTADEMLAGCDSLNFGLFGVADWYARRMGIADHDIVFATPWLRIWQCMDNDAKEHEYQRRLQEILTRKTQRQ